MKDNWINKLPGHSPKNETWQRIENELDFDEWFVENKETLPVHKANELTWSSIENQIEPKTKTPIFTTFFHTKYWLAAASVLVLLTLTWWATSPTENVKITYSTEVVKNKVVVIETTDLKAIDERCEELVVVCNTLEVKDLRQEIESLAEESEELREQAEVFGNDTKILEAQRKVEIQKAEMMKQLLDLMEHEKNS